jgi:hypothetical protein
MNKASNRRFIGASPPAAGETGVTDTIDGATIYISAGAFA